MPSSLAPAVGWRCCTSQARAWLCSGAFCGVCVSLATLAQVVLVPNAGLCSATQWMPFTPPLHHGFAQSPSSHLPKPLLWGHLFPARTWAVVRDPSLPTAHLDVLLGVSFWIPPAGDALSRWSCDHLDRGWTAQRRRQWLRREGGRLRLCRDRCVTLGQVGCRFLVLWGLHRGCAWCWALQGVGAVAGVHGLPPVTQTCYSLAFCVIETRRLRDHVGSFGSREAAAAELGSALHPVRRRLGPVVALQPGVMGHPTVSRWLHLLQFPGRERDRSGSERHSIPVTWAVYPVS